MEKLDGRDDLTSTGLGEQRDKLCVEVAFSGLELIDSLGPLLGQEGGWPDRRFDPADDRADPFA